MKDEIYVKRDILDETGFPVLGFRDDSETFLSPKFDGDLRTRVAAVEYAHEPTDDKVQTEGSVERPSMFEQAKRPGEKKIKVPPRRRLNVYRDGRKSDFDNP